MIRQTTNLSDHARVYSTKYVDLSIWTNAFKSFWGKVIYTYISIHIKTFIWFLNKFTDQKSCFGAQNDMHGLPNGAWIVLPFEKIEVYLKRKEKLSYQGTYWLLHLRVHRVWNLYVLFCILWWDSTSIPQSSTSIKWISLPLSQRIL